MASRLVAGLLPLACIVYAGAALVWRHSWISALAGVVVAALLWRRHPRARFAAYVFFSAMAVRAAATAAWPALAFAVVAVLVLQAPPAAAAWPRLRPGDVRGRGDRMPRP